MIRLTEVMPSAIVLDVGYDPYREEAHRMTVMLALGAAFVAGVILHSLIRPHLGALTSLALAVAGGLAVEVVLLRLLRRRRARGSTRP